MAQPAEMGCTKFSIAFFVTWLGLTVIFYLYPFVTETVPHLPHSTHKQVPYNTSNTYTHITPHDTGNTTDLDSLLQTGWLSSWVEAQTTISNHEVCWAQHSSSCSSDAFRKKQIRVFTSVQQIDFGEGVCITKVLSKGPSNTPPRAVHFLWRAPIFHSIPSVVSSFINASRHYYSESIGGAPPPKQTFKESDWRVYDRYRHSVEGLVTAQNPYYVEWAEEEPYLISYRNTQILWNRHYYDCKRNAYVLIPGPCYKVYFSTFEGYVKKAKDSFEEQANRIEWDLLETGRNKVVEKAIMVASYWSNEYYHFFAEAAPPLFQWLNFTIQNNLTVLIHGDTSISFLKGFFEFIGLPSYQLMTISAEHGPLVRNLFIPTPNPCLNPNAMSLRQMHDFILSRMPQIPDKNRTIMIVSREGEKRKRGIINEKQMVDALRKRFPNETFERHTSRLPFREQWEMWNRAKIVVAPHGAGLANMVACQRDTKIVEIGNWWAHNYFMEMAGRLHLEFHYLAGQSTSIGDRNSPINVDVEEVVKLIGEMLAQGYHHLRTQTHRILRNRISVAPDALIPTCCINASWVWQNVVTTSDEYFR